MFCLAGAEQAGRGPEGSGGSHRSGTVFSHILAMATTSSGGCWLSKLLLGKKNI